MAAPATDLEALTFQGTADDVLTAFLKSFRALEGEELEVELLVDRTRLAGGKSPEEFLLPLQRARACHPTQDPRLRSCTMKPLPHEYSVSASAADTGSVRLTSHELPVLESAPPVEFGGPGDQWSPEELFLAAVVDCFIFTFRAVARASKLEWKGIEATADGVLARIEHTTRFTGITLHAKLELGESGVNDEKALRLLEKAEKTCLVTNSLAVPVTLDAQVVPPEVTPSGPLP